MTDGQDYTRFWVKEKDFAGVIADLGAVEIFFSFA